MPDSMMTVKMEFDAREIRRAIERWDGQFPSVCRLIMQRIGQKIAASIKNFYLTGQVLKVFTGKLRKSVGSQVEDPFNVVVGTNLAYGAIHEYGGTVRAKRTKYLAIPTTPQAARHRPRDYDNLFVPRWSAQQGRPFLAMQKGSRLVAMYWLKRSVNIPARPWLLPAVQEFLLSGKATQTAELTIHERMAEVS